MVLKPRVLRCANGISRQDSCYANAQLEQSFADERSGMEEFMCIEQQQLDFTPRQACMVTDFRVMLVVTDENPTASYYAQPCSPR